MVHNKIQIIKNLILNTWWRNLELFWRNLWKLWKWNLLYW